MQRRFSREHIDLLFHDAGEEGKYQKRKRGGRLKDSPSFWSEVDRVLKDLISEHGVDINSPGWKAFVFIMHMIHSV